MFRQSPSRTQRSRGIKVKHVLQICFLLAICFWLLYQVKHSHDKKKEFDENEAKISQHAQGGGEIVKFGRKDLKPRSEDIATSTRSQDEESEEENVGEDEEIKIEEENAEDKKSEEKGAGDEDVEENEEDKSDAEVDREEDVVEEDKENEDNDPEDNDGAQVDNESSADENDDDEQAHEAREEHYKADDASSAVTHETEVLGAENENGNVTKSDEFVGANTIGNEQAGKDTTESTVGEQTTGSKLEDKRVTEEADPTNTTGNKDIENVNSKSDDSSDDHSNFVNNTSEANSVAHSLSTGNGTDNESKFSQVENVSTEGSTSGGGSHLESNPLDLSSHSISSSTENQADSNSTTSAKVEDADLNSGELQKADNSTLSNMPEELVKTSKETEDGSGLSALENNETAEGTESEDSSNDATDAASDEGASETENPDEIQHDLIDSSDSSISLEEKDVRTDLETLPEMQNEVSNDEDAAAE